MSSSRHSTSRPQRARRWATVGALLFFVACGGDDNRATNARVVEETIDPVPAPPSVPKAKRTNDGARAQRNLEAELRSLAAQNERRMLDRSRMARYIGLSLGRAEFFGVVSEYDRALAVTARFVAAKPELANAHLLRAQVLARVHRFSEAELALTKATELGASEARVAATRIPILSATRHLDEALALHDSFPPSGADALALGGRALLHVERGDTEAAVAAMEHALAQQRGISPFPVAWTYMQLGLMWQREGQTARARDHFEAAIERLPGYAPARGHLAAIEAERGNTARAIELVTPLVESSGDPEYAGQLSQWLADAPAAQMLERAKTGYNALTQRHPAAFADHAATFWQGPGADPARAHQLALHNLTVRPTDAAFQLALDTAHASQADADAACVLADRATALPSPSAYLLFTAARAYQTCNRPTEATAALTAAQTSPRAR